MSEKKWDFLVEKSTMSDGKPCFLANAMKRYDDWYGCGCAFTSEEAARGFLYQVQYEHKLTNEEIEWIGIEPWGKQTQMKLF